MRWRQAIRGMRTARKAADDRLRQFERTFEINEGAIKRVDICQLAANQPIEDFYSLGRCVSSRALLLAVCDGHGGSACSRFTSAHLMEYICAAVLDKHVLADVPVQQRLEWIFSSSDAHLNQENNLSAVEHRLVQFHKNFKSLDKGTVKNALQAAFLALDEDIAKSAMPDNKGRVHRMRASIAAAGSCATLAHIRARSLHVANAGDCAAVLGVESASGQVSSLQLSRPHCVENADEVARIKAAHPSSESNILRAGRLLGELYPLRAFGDVRYKWPLELQKAVLGPMGSPPPQNLLTPPYLTAMPEVFHHKLTANDRFLIVASDGLWEWFDPDTAVRLVRDHSFGALSLQPYEPTHGQTLAEVHEQLKARRAGERKRPLDTNAATHLLRHALGGVSGGLSEQYHRLHDQLQLPDGAARSYRDDISIMVAHFDEAYLARDDNDDASE
ncbi:hypothetical protein PFISCL1PPCAC_18387 [Pristionchus fissidentatus]|uniref:PPM-type phosphatase domain-containing protein n=1 Tax=Pristionchus fissidentatus TaxID=1538716 RepID=A0AAV5W9M3_9BILA|nr:hypothetical protein PFISCL1PPCAC_18387 [Pristionchus fissidentatus]